MSPSVSNIIVISTILTTENSPSIREGTDFADLKMVDGLELATEEYGIAFRQGSDFTAKVDETIKALVADGTLPALAEKYGLALAPAIAG